MHNYGAISFKLKENKDGGGGHHSTPTPILGSWRVQASPLALLQAVSSKLHLEAADFHSPHDHTAVLPSRLEAHLRYRRAAASTTEWEAQAKPARPQRFGLKAWTRPSPAKEALHLSEADGSSSQGLSLNRSQFGGCSTKYNTPAGT